MIDTEIVPTVRRCFCQIAVRELIRWARLKYVEGVSTVELLRLAADHQEREAIGIVALLDVPDEDMVRILSPLAPSYCNVLTCRDHLRNWLKTMLAFSGGHEVHHG
jgi:hypothetical protein